MADLADNKFPELLTMLESLESSFVRADDDSERDRIKGSIRRIIGEMKDEHFALYELFVEERIRQTESTLQDERKMLRELENEMERRRQKA